MGFRLLRSTQSIPHLTPTEIYRELGGASYHCMSIETIDVRFCPMLPNLQDRLPVCGLVLSEVVRVASAFAEVASPAGESMPVLVQYIQSLPLQECRFDDLINSSSNASSI